MFHLIRERFPKGRGARQNENDPLEKIAQPSEVNIDLVHENVDSIHCSQESSALLTTEGKLFLWGRNLFADSKEA